MESMSFGLTANIDHSSYPLVACALRDRYQLGGPDLFDFLAQRSTKLEERIAAGLVKRRGQHCRLIKLTYRHAVGKNTR